MLCTESWAKSFGISTDMMPCEVECFTKHYARTAQEIAVRTLILQGVIATASGVPAGPIIDWFQAQRIWLSVTPEEFTFLQNPSPAEEQSNKLRWHQEAEWTLLWIIGKVEGLGLPTQTCDTRRLCDEIMPALGDDIAQFLSSVELRSPGVLLAEDDRTYDLWCRVAIARHRGEPVPEDLDLSVLYERRYAFEWLDGTQDWDAVTCDA